MTREDIREKFNIIGDNKDISLYRKRGEFHYGTGYCGSISLERGKAVFNGEKYSDIESLDNALRYWEKSLEYPVDTYNPMYREGHRVHSRITWYLTEKMGFKNSFEDWKSVYKYPIGPNEIKFSVDIDKENEDKVIISSQWGGIYFSQSIDNEKNGIDIISSIIKSYVLTSAADTVKLLSVCPEEVSNEIDTMVRSNESFFGWKPIGYKELMIGLLEKQLEELKK